MAMSSLQSNERSSSVTDKSGTGPSTTSLASDTASTKVSRSDPSTIASSSITSSTEIFTAPPTKTIVETATATVTKTSIATTTTTPVSGDTGFSGDAIPIIAAVSGVAVLALALCAVLLHLKKRYHELAQNTTPHAAPNPSTKNLMVVPGFVGLPNRVLLTGVSDSDLKRKLGSLGRLIQDHVENHYHLGKVPATSDTLHASLRQLHLNEATCSMVARLSLDPSTRYIGIRHLLARVIFSNLDIHTVDALSPLPPTFKEFSRSRARSPKQDRDPLVETALVSWYRITSFLMHESPDLRTPLHPPPDVESQTDALITLLQTYLDDFVRRDKVHLVKHQQDGLAGVIRQCAQFGYELFSHPSDWEFTFPQEEQGVIVVPGLVQRSSSTGELYYPPKQVLAPEIVAVNPKKS